LTFGCGVHNFGGLIYFDIEWRQREAREQEERRIEARRQEIHTREGDVIEYTTIKTARHENEPEPERHVCEHCGQRPANVRGKPYCDRCWHTELTDCLYCPNCDAFSTIDKQTPTDEEITCWACKVVNRKLAWCEHTDIRALEKEKFNLQHSLKGRFQSILEAATFENLLIIEKVITDMDNSLKAIRKGQVTG
jgi:hypothetical protein